MIMKNLLYLCVILSFTVFVHGAVFMSLDNCPTGIQPGETWMHSEYKCTQCTCMDKGYRCASCGVMVINPNPGCYVDTKPDAPYPECCMKYHVCPGDQSFDQNKYHDFMQQQLGK